MSYATTPTLSVDAPHDSVRLVCPMFEQLGWPGWVGGWVSPDGPVVSVSAFGPPVAFTAVALIVLLPAFRVAVMVMVGHVSQLAVAGNETPPIASEPLTLMSMGRSAVEPLAYRNESLVVPADETFTVHWTELPATFV